MPLGTLDRTPPPFFKQGPSALSKLMVVQRARAVPDGGRHALPASRSRCARRSRTVLYPVQWVAAAAGAGGARRRRLLRVAAQRADDRGRRPRAQAGAAGRSAPTRSSSCALENARLRELLALRERSTRAARPPRCCTTRADPYTRKVIIDRGIDARHRGRLAGDRRVRRARPGHARHPLHQRSDAADRPRPGHPGAEHAHRRAQRGLRRPGGARRRAGAALHGRQRRRPGRRPAHHLRRRRRLPAGPAGGQGRQGRAPRRLGFARIALRAAGAGRRRAPRDGARADVGADAAAARARRAPRRRRSRRARRASREARDDHASRASSCCCRPTRSSSGSACCWRCWSTCCRSGRTPWMPDLLALVLVFWSVHQPLRVGIGAAFVFGLLMDVHQAALLGQHALAYTALELLRDHDPPPPAVVHACRRRRCRCCRCSRPRTPIELAIRMLAGGMFPGWACCSRPWSKRCCGRWSACCCWRRSAARPIRTRIGRCDASACATLAAHARAHDRTAQRRSRPLAVPRARAGAPAWWCWSRFAAAGARLVYLQVCRHDDLREQAENNRTAIVPVVPNRGLILDRNGIVLATNYSAYTLEITPSRADGDAGHDDRRARRR